MARMTGTLKTICSLALLIPMLGAAQAQSGATREKPPAPGGADANTFKNGIARDPSEVQAQQGNAAKASPGTIGAAPGADTPSQTPRK